MATLINSLKENKSNTPTAMDQKVMAYLNATSLEYYDTQIAEEENFQVWYQLSSLRTGLVSWYPFEKEAAILEIGAGFGALTGMLCEKCEKVVATERSLVRAEAIAKRWKTKENLTIYAGEWSEMEFSQKFDYILITGVMERIGGGSSLKQVYVDYLKKTAKLLTPNGKLLVSVENRYGLRYFCGAVEPHTNRAFDGIRKYMQGTRGYSFSRQELEDIVTDAGFVNHKFYYPLPDYKFPQLIYTDTYLPEKNLKERLIPYYVRKDTLVAPELEIYDDVIANGVFPFFANSFLVECSTCLDECLSDVVYSAVSTDRGKNRAFTTSITEGGVVRKEPIFSDGYQNTQKLYNNIMDLKVHGIPVVEHRQTWSGGLELPFIKYPTLSNALKEIMPKDINKFERLIDRIYENILKSSEETSKNTLIDRLTSIGIEREELGQVNFGPILEKAYMELIPLNCFYDIETDAFLYFDQEFVRENYPAKYVLFRAIHYIYCFTPNAEQYLSKQNLIRKYDMQDCWKYFEKEESLFLEEVRNHKQYAQFYKWANIDVKRMLDNSDRLISEEEVIANYKISDKMKKVWNVELEMLDEVMRICQKHHLRYFLVHGSLLGAVRHKGFIPWDDDLDIAMPREDYDKFLVLAAKELKKPLSIHTIKTESDLFWGGYARIRNEKTAGIEAKNLGHDGNLGIWVDIMPLDVCPMDDELLQKKTKKVRHCQRLLYAKTYGKDDWMMGYKWFAEMSKPLWILYLVLSKLYTRKQLSNMLDDAMKMYSLEPSEDVAFFTGYDKHRRLCGKDFESATELVFEERKVNVPKGYENHLFMTLGKDYMKYPPEEQRKPHHRGIMDAEHSYTLYNDLLCHMLDDVKGKTIILFGAGLMFEDYMKKYGDKYRPSFIVDNDENKWGRHRMGIEIRKPEDILDIPETSRHVIICSYYYKEIIPQLEAMGVKDCKVYVQNVEWILETEQKYTL